MSPIRGTPGKRLLGVALLLVVPLSLAWRSLRPGVELDYRVIPSSSGIDVDLSWDKHPSGSEITLTRLAGSKEPRVVSVEARDGQGRSLPVIEEKARGGRPRWRVAAAARSVARVRYRVTPATHAGNGMSESGFSAFTPSWSLIRGRDLFLVPERTDEIKAVSVGFKLPRGIQAVAPWRDPDIGNAALRTSDLEEILATPLAFGRFEAVAFRHGGTDYRWFFEASIPAAERTRAATALGRVVTELADAVGRPLGSRYTGILTPAADDHGSPAGEAWGSGQGGALWPLTTTRLRTFALGLADAYLLARPHRFEFDAANESWLPVALRGLLAERAVGRARGLEAPEVDRVLAYRYAMLPVDLREDLDLERVTTPFPTKEHQARVLADAGPYVLARLDRLLAARDGRGSPLTAALRRAARRDHVSSFWQEFDAEYRTAIQAYRARFVRGRELLDLSPDRDSAAFAWAPPRPAPIVRRIHLAATGQTLGYLEPCGCQVNQSGGVAKRARRIAELRARHPSLLLVDAGSSFGDPTELPVLDPFARGELELYLGVVERMEYDALAPGWTDLVRGPSLFTALGVGSGLPYTAANLRRGSVPLAPALRQVERSGMRVRIVGVFEPPGELQRVSRLDASLDSLEIEAAVASVSRAFADSPANELGIVLGEMSNRTVREIVRRCPQVDVIVTSPDRLRGELTANGSPSTLSPVSGFLDSAYVLYADLGEYGIEVVHLGLDARGRVAEASIEAFDLGEDVAEDPAVLARLDHFYTTVARDQAATAVVEIPAAADPERRGGYAGRQACASCHPSESAQWETTTHARAFKTLLDAHRHYQPRCVSCHVVGFGAPDGYRPDSRKLVDVQCEACHGPGAAHVREPRRGTITRSVPETVCRSCHTPEHSEAFDYSDRLPRVAHGATPMASRASRP